MGVVIKVQEYLATCILATRNVPNFNLQPPVVTLIQYTTRLGVKIVNKTGVIQFFLSFSSEKVVKKTNVKKMGVDLYFRFSVTRQKVVNKTNIRKTEVKLYVHNVIRQKVPNECQQNGG